MLKIDSRWIWIALCLITLLIRVVLRNSPEFIEQYYSRSLFPLIRTIFDYTTGWLPFATLYLLLLGIICFILIKVFHKSKKKRSVKKRIINFVFSLTAFVAAIVFLFLILWGFNYSRVPVEKQIGLEVKPLNKDELFNEFLKATEELEIAYLKIQHLNEQEIDVHVRTNAFEEQTRLEITTVFQKLGYPVPGRVRGRMLFPKGTLLRISTAGFYLPFTGECHLDPGLHALQIPYVMAHEMAHGLGIGDEGSCNFFAYLSCSSSDDPLVKYAGLLSYWRSVAAQYRRFDREHYKALRAKMNPGILEHLEYISLQMDKYPDIFPAVRDATYNAYLKTQGIEEGMKNYSRVLLLVYAYRKSKK